MVELSGISIESEEIVEYLKQELYLKEICHKLLCQRIIQRVAQEQGITITPEEIQAEADRQRYQRRLESAEATLAWLEDQMITVEEWEMGIRRYLLAQKLAEALFEQEVEKYFVEHRLDFEQVSFYKITVPYEQLAQELLYQIEEDEISFYEAAHLYDVDEQRRLYCGYEGQFYRWKLKPELAALIFGARLGEVIGPCKSEQGYDLLLVEEFTMAELTEEIRKDILNNLFQEWLNSELNYLLHHSSSP
ncbi:peptidylprolyl isomerase [Thermocoleostomius sinensis]|jgi:parvulin-like peptidyl-prolyl isomerase|uniref:peptidylprolyl isomerase n=1 Tax=Thermocoleostomius sinensis A174 TaxID=2016057 RepID=A0A9E8ZCQ4_9CYAN|nr:peptidylprolyl isomerase [Thermocoleostomius sinensis]WAL60502.1 peptidylprolyl isomerase [Thermocoleostomius sinensis A174]